MSIHSQEKGRHDQYLCVFNTAYYHHNQLCIIIVWILSCIHFFRIRLSSQFLLATVLIVLSSYRLLTVCFPADFPKYLLSLPNYTQARRISQVVNAWESPPPSPLSAPPSHTPPVESRQSNSSVEDRPLQWADLLWPKSVHNISAINVRPASVSWFEKREGKKNIF